MEQLEWLISEAPSRTFYVLIALATSCETVASEEYAVFYCTVFTNLINSKSCSMYNYL